MKLNVDIGHRPTAARFGLLVATVVIALVAVVPCAFGAAVSYEGISATLSGLALCAVAVSILIQSAQVRTERIYSMKQWQNELIKMFMEDVSLYEVVEPEWASSSILRQAAYANLWMGFWFAAWRVGEIDSAAVHVHATTMFRSPAARQWWNKVGKTWGLDGSPGGRRFNILVNSAFACAAAMGPEAEALKHP